MRRQKRDLSERSFQRGYQAGLVGKNKDSCPHDKGDNRDNWMSGWREGRSDKWDGYTGVSGIHKLNIH